MKKLLVFLLAACMIGASAFSLTSCKKGGGDGAIKIGVKLDESEITTAEAIIKAFNVKYPDIKVEIDPIGGDYQTAIMQRQSSSSMPDVIWVGDDDVTTFAEKNIIYNLDEYMERDSFDTSLYFESMIKLGQKGHNGSQYMLPRDYNKIVVYYNKDIFDACGVAYPTDSDWTWDDFLATCKALKDGANGRPGLKADEYAVDAKCNFAPVYYSMIKSFGGSIITGGQSSVVNDGVKRALETMLELHTKGYDVSYADGVDGNLFFSKKVAMWFAVRPMVSSIMSRNIKFDVVGFPKLGEGMKIGAGCSGYSIAAKSENKENAWTLLKFIVSEEGQNAFASTGNSVPVLKSLAQDDSADWRELLINHDAFIDGEDRDQLVDYLDTVDSELHMDIDGFILNMIYDTLDGTETPDEAMADCNRKIKSAILNN